ncbi:MAG: ABC transporter permease [Betaproteobacteria bacterium]|nr:ABC transporter permease [Betaproteobacteria bacterium]
MDLLEPTRQAFALLLAGDPRLLGAIWLSLWVSAAAIAIVSPPSIALGFLLAKKRFPGQRSLVVLVQALLSFPTVVIGLLIYLLLSRRGPLGALELLFTPTAIMIGYMLIAFPILVVFTISAVQGADPRIYETARALGAGRVRASLTTLREVRFGVLAAVVNGFGRVVSEVGCAIMVGGNIEGLTRNIPTAIALETTKGEFAQGIALGMVLMAVALGVNVLLAALQGEGGLR